MTGIKKILRLIVPKRIRLLLWGMVPKIHRVNTYLLQMPLLINDLHQVDEKYSIREISKADEEKLKKANAFRGTNSYVKRIIPRLNSPEWTGLAVFNETNGDIAYLAWVITRSIRYFEEFGIILKEGQFLLKDGFCVPEYRHQGLHTRMEQERINYCIRNGANEIFIQINDDNEKGKNSVIGNGYKLYKQNYVLQWPIFNVFRELRSFIMNPFLKVIK